MDQLTIGKVSQEADWLIVKTFLGYLFDFEKSVRDVRKPTERILDGSFRYLRENIDKSRGAAFIARDGESPVGIITGWVEQGDGQDEGSNDFGYVSDAFVIPLYRGKGAFRSLLNEMTGYYRSIGVEKMSVSTLATNADMQSVLEKCGFSRHKIAYDMNIGS